MKQTVGIIGGGNMGTAILSRLAGHYKVFVCEKDRRRAVQLKRKYRVVIKDLAGTVKSSSILLIAVKPQDIDGLLREIALHITRRQLVVSIAAGVTTEFLQKRLGRGVRVIRTMPNMPARIGEGITAIAAGRAARKSDVASACRIFNRVGETVVVKEGLLDAVTAVSGSGPAYIFLVAECLMAASRKLGLSPALSRQLVLKTLAGSAALLLQAKEDPSRLRAKVTSRGGTTQAAMDIFARSKINSMFARAMKAAKQRSRQLSRR